MTTLLPYQTTELSDEIDPCEISRLELLRDMNEQPSQRWTVHEERNCCKRI